MCCIVGTVLAFNVRGDVACRVSGFGVEELTVVSFGSGTLGFGFVQAFEGGLAVFQTDFPGRRLYTGWMCTLRSQLTSTSE